MRKENILWLGMAKHNELGKEGENAAVHYLEQRDYVILDRNWRRKHLEVDIVALHHDTLVFIEVKTRANTKWMEPEEAVDLRKVRFLSLAADAYIKTHELDLPFRFDVVSVVGETEPFQINHIQEAFYPPVF